MLKSFTVFLNNNKIQPWGALKSLKSYRPQTIELLTKKRVGTAGLFPTTLTVHTLGDFRTDVIV